MLELPGLFLTVPLLNAQVFAKGDYLSLSFSFTGIEKCMIKKCEGYRWARDIGSDKTREICGLHGRCMGTQGTLLFLSCPRRQSQVIRLGSSVLISSLHSSFMPSICLMPLLCCFPGVSLSAEFWHVSFHDPIVANPWATSTDRYLFQEGLKEVMNEWLVDADQISQVVWKRLDKSLDSVSKVVSWGLQYIWSKEDRMLDSMSTTSFSAESGLNPGNMLSQDMTTRAEAIKSMQEAQICKEHCRGCYPYLLP